MRQLFNNTEITMPKEQNFSSCHDCVQRCDFSVVVVFVFFKPFFHSFNLTLDEQTKKNDGIFIWNDSGLSHTRIVMHTAVCLCALFCHASQLTTVYMFSPSKQQHHTIILIFSFFSAHTHKHTHFFISLRTLEKSHNNVFIGAARTSHTHKLTQSFTHIHTRGPYSLVIYGIFIEKHTEQQQNFDQNTHTRQHSEGENGQATRWCESEHHMKSRKKWLLLCYVY